MAADVVMYKTRFCPYCTRASALLKQKGAVVTEIDVSNDDAKRDWLIEATGRRTVPQIFINGVPVGGFDDIAALDRKAMLDPMLREEPPQKRTPPAP
jgi:glutaredoxin 3